MVTACYVQGNWGNALMAYGSLQKRRLGGLAAIESTIDPAEVAHVATLKAQLLQSASDALLDAGKNVQRIMQALLAVTYPSHHHQNMANQPPDTSYKYAMTNQKSNVYQQGVYRARNRVRAVHQKVKL